MKPVAVIIHYTGKKQRWPIQYRSLSGAISGIKSYLKWLGESGYRGEQLPTITIIEL